MAHGYSLHIGINFLDTQHYGGNGKLSSCENDARYMLDVLGALGYESKLLLSENATRKNVYKHFAHYATKAVKGDIVVITYSGHGSFIPDYNKDEDDNRDETWCLHDAQLIDDEIHRLLSAFNEGVRVLIITDSCHNRTIYKSFNTPSESLTKNLEQEKSFEVFHQNKLFYETILQQLDLHPRPVCKANVITLSACEDHDQAISGYPLSEFTQNIREVWDNGKFSGDYGTFIEKIAQKTTDRNPQISLGGIADQTFARQRPFTIS
ncbi:caspase family protein [Fulvivirga sp. M361]|uniref:caspase family protein n=1 Tax=Fulvivirga sp. M361 TaxID=2594266 RepID=UPI00117A0C2E|nr:caspase family protein [Fulvivirga sp. M361]TRX58752.1 caspase family protein [Fulvivirga sp. M361]